MLKTSESKMLEFSYEDVINKPNNYNIQDFDIYNHTLAIIFSYKNKDEKYNNFLKQVQELQNNLEYIKEQYAFVPIYNQLIDVTGDYYLDSERKQEILFQLKPLVDNIKKVGKAYYAFPELKNIDAIVNIHNEEYIQTHLNDEVFNFVNEKSLNNEQRRSILCDEKASLTIAGAGSGKTLTICGKVKYLLEHNKVNPKDILLLSYSKRSSMDLKEKVRRINDGLTVKTFHALGFEIFKIVQNIKPTVEEQYDAIIEAYFRDELQKQPHMMAKVLQFFSLYLVENKNSKKYETQGELYADLKTMGYDTLKTTLLRLTNDIDKRETIKKECVKSFEELAIANYYFINGIEYVYEAPYCVDVATEEKRQYTPDFYLKKYQIYHEHYGIGKDGKAHQYQGKEAQNYVDGIVWKRQTHTQNNTICIETYSYEFSDGTIFDQLERKLKENGVEFNPLSYEETLKVLNSIYRGQNFKSFINLIKSFLSLYKARYKDNTYFAKLKLQPFENAYEKKRIILLLDIIEEVYLYYMRYLRKEDKIDFDDMILQSIEFLDKTDAFKYKYIVVDEFQDISYSRMKFLKKLMEKGNSKLYAVGDDWQAIYRFSGCDLNIFLHFENYFDYALKTFITTEHRNSQELQDIMGMFIKANPEQYHKEIKSNKHLENPIKVVYYFDDKYASFLTALRSIYKINKEANILVLGRNNHDIDELLGKKLYFDTSIKDENEKRLIFADCKTFHIKYSTVHGSKGLEDDFVILINADDSRLGFPNKVEDDKILNLVLSAKSNFEYDEERRLWYVALTRTKSYVYIIANKERPSIFLNEIIDLCEILNPESQINFHSCPYCKSGKLIKRINEFYGCSNYPYCKYTIHDFVAVDRNIKCPKCGDFMVEKMGRYGVFYGCHSYPRCNYTVDITKIPKI